jgi:trans-aconitate methyltransferase
MSIDRLLSLQAENDLAGAEMMIESERFDRIRGIKPRAVSAFNLFQTPEVLADRAVSLIPEGFNPKKILEPSAGLGRLYRAMLKRFPEATYTLIENSPECSRELWELPVEFLQRDFLTVCDRQFNLIVMNPPFKNGADVKHINHALKLLAPGGFLVAFCYNGVRQNKYLRTIASTWEVLPTKAFKESGTNANSVLLTIY